MKKYKATNLVGLVKEMAAETASRPEVLTATHLLYAYLCLFTMPRQEVLAEVGGDERRNVRVLAALEAAWNRLPEQAKYQAKYGKRFNLEACKALVWAYLPVLEQRGDVEERRKDYKTTLRLFGSCPGEDSEYECFCRLFYNITSPHGLSEYIAECEKEGYPLPKDAIEISSKTVLLHWKLLGEIAYFSGAQIAAVSLQKESEDKVSVQVKKLQKALESVVGQELAVRSFLDTYKKAHYFKNRQGKPLVVCLLAGPPGVGKTLLAETAAKALDMPYKRFDMSEYGGVSADNVQGLVGFEQSWKDAVPGVLTGYVDTHPRSLILFDEIEKAAPVVLKIFLQVLNDGRLTDKYTTRTVSFENTILLFTTNAGRELYEDNYGENLSALPAETIVAALQKDESFPNELVSRFAANSIIMFNHIGKMHLMDIAMNAMKRTVKNARREIYLEDAEALAQLLLLHEGAKCDARMITAKAEDMISQALLDYMDYEADRETEKEYPITIRIEREENEAGRYLFMDEENPVRVLYLTDLEASEIERKIDVRAHFDLELLDNKDHPYQMVVIDPFCGVNAADRGKKILERDSEGNRVLRELLKHPGRCSVYVADDGGLETEERRYLFQEGIAGILHSDPDGEYWGKVIARHHIVRSQEAVANEGKMIDYRVVPEIGKSEEDILEGTITFRNFSLGDAAVNDAAARAFDKDAVLSDWERPKTRFEDVIGAENAKRELRHFIKYVKNPEYYDMIGLSMPRGVLLYGPPGTGKTMLARAAAGESGVSFIAVSASDFEQKYTGTGEQKIRDIFAAARRNSPAILFIDEIDTIGKERTGSEVTHHTEKLLNTLLTEIDGFADRRSRQVFVMAATNFDIDGTKSGKPVRIDPALTRRFPTQIYVDLPSREERVQYVKMYLEKKGAKSNIIDMERIADMAEAVADQTVGQSLAIVENMLEYALRQFAMNRDELPQNEKLTEELLLEYVQEMRYGEKSHSPEVSTAYHEAAHAFMAWKVGETPAFLTIVSRDDFGGYVQRKESDRTVFTEKDLRNRIKISLAGRAGEIIYYKYYADGEGNAELLKEAVNTGAGSDLSNATRCAKRIVAGIGRSDDSLARIPEEEWSDAMSREVLEEVNLLLKVEMDRTLRIAEENKELIHRLALAAIEKTQLTEKQILEVLEAE